MDAIEKIVEQILEKGTREAEAVKKSEVNRIESNFYEQIAALDIQKKQQITKNAELSKKIFRQKQNRQQLEVKQATLNSKQELLGQLFKETTEKMKQWDTETFQQFASGMLSKLDLSGEVVFNAGEYSKDKISQTWLDQFATDKLTLQLSEKIIPKESGFVLAKDGIEYNFLFSTLVQEVQTTEIYKIAEMLFG
ncbi:hypothetical protein IW492_09720 [Enterococcus sp. BWB1-3]|uniref:hypothetical protein n=1 Tax=unclassified Enterococcus TaxID=2608891 RepID=UPI0019225FB8|nr:MULTISPECIES: hypothetical protein [unclassified Enterococcus]MBL1229509.1 hypothetical protein [Enterococcus sp. BWB1-3]MCB5955241.1 hypothetical protein [Enterococcus sp. CWB-B31]